MPLVSGAAFLIPGVTLSPGSSKCGQVAERLIAPVLKTGERASVPGVRIPPCPPPYACSASGGVPSEASL